MIHSVEDLFRFFVKHSNLQTLTSQSPHCAGWKPIWNVSKEESTFMVIAFCVAPLSPLLSSLQNLQETRLTAHRWVWFYPLGPLKGWKGSISSRGWFLLIYGAISPRNKVCFCTCSNATMLWRNWRQAPLLWKNNTVRTVCLQFILFILQVSWEFLYKASECSSTRVCSNSSRWKCHTVILLGQEQTN